MGESGYKGAASVGKQDGQEGHFSSELSPAQQTTSGKKANEINNFL